MLEMKDVISTFRKIYKKGTDSFSWRSKKMIDDQPLKSWEHLRYTQSGTMQFNPKLLKLIKDGKNREVKRYLKSHLHCNKVDGTGASLLHHSAQYHNCNLTEYLIRFGYNVEVIDKNGNTPLLIAVITGIVLEDDTSEVNFNQTIAALLDECSNMHIRNSNGDNALSIVFRYTSSRHKQVVNMFLNKVKEESSNKREVIARILYAMNCPLPLAYKLGGLKLTRDTMELGTSIDSFDRITGETALHVAVASSDLNAVKFLLEHKANVNIVDFEKRTPLMHYDTKRDDEPIEILQILFDYMDCESTKILLSNGKRNTVLMILQADCDFYARNKQGETVVHFLAKNPNPNVISEVLQGKKFNVNARDNHGNTPLMNASIAGHNHAVEFLLNQGAEVDIPNCQSLTPLHAIFFTNSTCKNSYAEIIECLLLHGADIQYEAIFNLSWYEDNHKLIVTILAHLAIIEACGDYIDVTIYDEIAMREWLTEEYLYLRSKLVEMTIQKIYKNVTLFELLIENDEKIEIYAKDKEFVRTFRNFMADQYLKSYFLDVIERRVDKAICKVRTKKTTTSTCSVM